MDYIREELLRQRNAWAALLRSGQRDETEALSEQQVVDSRVLEPAKETDRTYGLPAAEAETAKTAPHGAGRIMSRGQARRTLSLEDFRESMEGIFTTSVEAGTLDESPMVYKPMDEIVSCIEPTVTIEQVIRPIYNLKASS